MIKNVLQAATLVAIVGAACLVGGCSWFGSTPAPPDPTVATTDAVGKPAAQPPNTTAAGDPSPTRSIETGGPTPAAAGAASPSRPAELPDPTRPDAAQLNQRQWFAWLPRFSLPTLGIPRVHKIVIQQGNVITQAMVNRLKPGMTRAQVEFVMGKPVLDNLFRSDRWVYVFEQIDPDVRDRRLAMTLYFDKDSLLRLSGDLVPGGGNATTGADEPIPVPSAFVPRSEKDKDPRGARGRPSPQQQRRR